MPVITLPDGSQRQFDHPVSVMDVAKDIGPGLAKACVAGRINGQLVDACEVISEDASLAIITMNVITSYSIHYTKLYEIWISWRPLSNRARSTLRPMRQNPLMAMRMGDIQLP